MTTLLIAKLQCQKALMKRNAEGEAHIVYGYLRAKDSGTGKAGSPYYIGIGNSHRRAFAQHTRGGKSSRYHNVPVPKNEALVRQFGVFKTRAEAAAREQALIAQYGRKGLDPGGKLLNRTLGGEGTLGAPRTKQQAEKYQATRATQAAARYGVNADSYKALSREEKKYFARWVKNNPGSLPFEFFNLSPEARRLAAAKNSGATRSAKSGGGSQWGMNDTEWNALNETQKALVRFRYKSGKRGEDLRKGLEVSKSEQLALAYGIDLQQWKALDSRARNVIRGRYARGKRGAALLEGLI